MELRRACQRRRAQRRLHLHLRLLDCWCPDQLIREPSLPPLSRGAALMTPLLSVVSLTPHAFAALGLEEIAYVKPIGNIEPIYAIHAADGTQLALVSDPLEAAAMIRRHDLEPINVH